MSHIKSAKSLEKYIADEELYLKAIKTPLWGISVLTGASERRTNANNNRIILDGGSAASTNVGVLYHIADVRDEPAQCDA